MLTLKNTKKLNLYKSLDSLKILTFWKILETKNACLLDFDYSIDKKYTQDQQHEIELTWLRLYDEFFVLRDDKGSKADIDKGFEELKIKSQILNVSHNYNYLIKIAEFSVFLKPKDVEKRIKETYDRLKGLYGIGNKLNIDYNASLEINLKTLERVINSLQNTYNLNFKESEKAVKQEIKNVYDIVAIAEDELNRHIPIEDIVCTRWLSYEKQVNEKQRKRSKDG